MDSCDIPLALMNGDTLTAGVLDTDTSVINTLNDAMKLYEPIGMDRLMLVRGNHDDVYGESGGVSYVNKVAPSKIWNKLHRPQANDFRRVLGGDGTYFYLDNIPQKVRFICLNSHFYDGDAVTNGTTQAMTFAFGATQLEWLENKALAVENDWSVVITFHAPTIADYASKFSRTDYTDFNTVGKHLREHSTYSPSEARRRALKGLYPQFYKRKGINQYTWDGKFVQHYSCAEEVVGKNNYDASHLQLACRGERIMRHNYQWRYDDMEAPKPLEKPYFSKRRIAQYSLEGDLIKIFPSAAAAAREVSPEQNSNVVGN